MTGIRLVLGSIVGCLGEELGPLIGGGGAGAGAGAGQNLTGKNPEKHGKDGKAAI
jgi:hypothetical protein